MTINELYSALFEAINDKNIEQANNLLTNENIDLLKTSYVSRDGRYQELCFQSMKLDNESVFLSLCNPALQLLQDGNGSTVVADSIARIFLPSLIKKLAVLQKNNLIDTLIKVCIAEELKRFCSNKTRVDLNSVAKINMMVAAVAAYNGTPELKDEYARLVRQSLDFLLDTTFEEKVNYEVFLAVRLRILTACFAQGARDLAESLLQDNNYWLLQDSVAREQDKTFNVVLSLIAVDDRDLIEKYLARTILDKAMYARLLRAAIVRDRKTTFNYILQQFAEKMTMPEMLNLMGEACKHYIKKDYYLGCLLRCDWLNSNQTEKRSMQLQLAVRAVIAVKKKIPELLGVLLLFTAEDIEKIKVADSELYNNFCEKLKSKYSHVFVQLICDSAYKKVKDFVVGFKDLIAEIDDEQQKIGFRFNNPDVHSQFMGEWLRKYAAKYAQSVELSPVKFGNKIEVIISKTKNLSLIQVDECCEKIKTLIGQVVLKLKPVIKKINKVGQENKPEVPVMSKAEKRRKRKEREAQKKMANDPLQRHKDPSEFESSDLVPIDKIIGSDHGSHVRFLFFKQFSFFEWRNEYELDVSCNGPRIARQ